MRAIVFVLAVSFVAVSLAGMELTDEHKAILKTFENDCIAETKVDPAVLENAENGKLDESDEKLACFATCLLKKVKLITADGNTDWEAARVEASQIMSQDQIDSLVEKCSNVGGDGCKMGLNLLKCIVMNAISEDFFS